MGLVYASNLRFKRILAVKAYPGTNKQ